MALDPVDYAVISQALLAAAREMGTKLVRSAYSNIVREARDASAAILDPDGNIVAQSEMVPMQLGSMNTTLRACLSFYPAETLTADDVREVWHAGFRPATGSCPAGHPGRHGRRRRDSTG